EKPVVRDPILVLNGEGQGPINNMCVPSLVSPSYAPPGKSLVSVSVIDPEAIHRNKLETEVRQQLRDWFGAEVDAWHHLRTFKIPYALPSQPVGFLERSGDPTRIREGLYGCGDYRATASIHGAMLSGRLAAEAIIKDQAREPR
ncbi:MAG: FAD-dependent oxidoreductase, partial [Gemmataceae bacterium]